MNAFITMAVAVLVTAMVIIIAQSSLLLALLYAIGSALVFAGPIKRG